MSNEPRQTESDRTEVPDAVTERRLLVEISAQLAEVNHHLRRLNPETETVDTPDETSGEQEYECATCGVVVAEADRQQHMIDRHNMPAGVSVYRHFNPTGSDRK